MDGPVHSASSEPVLPAVGSPRSDGVPSSFASAVRILFGRKVAALAVVAVALGAAAIAIWSRIES